MQYLVALTLHIVMIEFLDEEEFGEAAESRTYDENSSNPAMELGLLVSKLKFMKSNLFKLNSFQLL